MTTDLVAWFGPVAEFQVPGATVPDATKRFYQCVGALGKPVCHEVAWSFTGADKHSVPGLLSRSGVAEADVRDIFLGAFSAGGGVVRHLLFQPADRQRVRAVLLSDATYSGEWADKARRIPFVNQTWVEWGAEVATGDGSQLWVATASPSPNFDKATGVEVLQEIRRQLEERLGRRFERLAHFYGVEPAPAAAYKLGNVVLAEYPLEPLGHAHTQIAPQVWQKILWPWLEALRSGRPAPGGPEDALPRGEAEPPTEMAWWVAMALGASALASWLLVKFLRRRL